MQLLLQRLMALRGLVPHTCLPPSCPPKHPLAHPAGRTHTLQTTVVDAAGVGAVDDNTAYAANTTTTATTTAAATHVTSAAPPTASTTTTHTHYGPRRPPTP